jgi:hypothetical protein
MLIIYCSTKLVTLVGSSKLTQVGLEKRVDKLNAWNAQLFTVQRKKCILVTNKATLYSFIRLNVLKKDLLDLNNFFTSSLLTQLKADALYNDAELNSLEGSFTSISFSRTDNDKPVIGSINDLIYQLKVAIDYNIKGLANPTNTSAGSYLNNLIMGYINYETPIDRFRRTKNNA